MDNYDNDDVIVKRGILLAMEKFTIKDEKTGEVNEGLSVQYLLTTKLHPVQKNELHGVRIHKGWWNVKMLTQITNVPAMYEFSLEMDANTSGKAKLEVVSLKYLSDVELVVKSKK